MDRRSFLKLSATLGLTALISNSLIGCANEPTYIEISECFNHNNEGVDDLFEQMVEKHEDLINQISTLESYIELSEPLDGTFELLTEEDKEQILNSSKKDLDYVIPTPQEFEEKINEATKRNRKSAIYEIELYKDYINIINYIESNGYQILEKFGIELVKVASLSANNPNEEINTNNIEINKLPNVPDAPYTIIYNKGKQDKQMVAVNRNTMLGQIIKDIYECQENEKDNKSFGKDDYTHMKQIIKDYKIGLNMQYNLENPLFGYETITPTDQKEAENKILKRQNVSM